jgi:hypothetical protein
MAHTRKHRRDNAVSADDLRRDFFKEHREVPDYFKRDPKGESSMLPDYLEGRQKALDTFGLPNESEMASSYMEGRQEVLDATGLPNEAEYLEWASENREMLGKFMAAMAGQNETSKAAGGGRNNRNKTKTQGLDFEGTWAEPTKEQISKSESKAADRENYRKQKGNRDSQGTLMTAAQQEAEADRIYNEYGKTMGTHVLEDEDDSSEWGMSDWAGWLSDLVGSPKGK